MHSILIRKVPTSNFWNILNVIDSWNSFNFHINIVIEFIQILFQTLEICIQNIVNSCGYNKGRCRDLCKTI